jgi:hypothetical protein
MERGSEGDLQENGGQSYASVSAGQETSLGWTDLLKQSYGLYRTHFLAFFRMAFLPFVLAYLFSQAWRLAVRPFLVRLLMRLIEPAPSRIDFESFTVVPPHWYSYFLTMANVLRLVEGAVYWFLSAFLFAAVATYVLDEEPNPRPLADAYSKARDKIGAILLLSLFSWTFFMLVRLASRVAVWKIIDGFHLGRISASVLLFIPSILICGLLSRLGLVIPWLIDRPSDSFFSAIRNSIRKTENWEAFFMGFVIKSAIAGYAVYWIADRGLDWLWQRDVLPALNPWIARFVYISIAGALETPLFIALSVLYHKQTVTRANSIPATVG